MADTQVNPQTPCEQEERTGGLPKGAKTSDYYRVNGIPARFDNPGKCYSTGNPVFSCTLDIPSQIPEQPTEDGADWFQGYSTKPVNPMYRTSNSDYGICKPTVHTMPTCFHAKTQKFSEHLGTCGMYRNHSLNCATDKAVVPDH